MNNIPELEKLVSIRIIQEDAEAIYSLLSSERDSIFAIEIIPYYALFVQSCQEYMGENYLPEEAALRIKNIRNHIKSYSESFGKTKRKVASVDQAQDTRFKSQLRFNFLKAWNIHLNLGTYWTEDHHIIGNTQQLFNNPDRIKYHERYQQIIEEYNSQQDRATIEKTFDELMQLVKDMDQEEQRYVREGFSSDEELSLYDMLFSENLSKQDIQKIKKVAVDLLEKVKAKIAELDHWTDKQETKATIDNLIRDTLWAELPESYDEVSISVYRQKIYEYVYTRYKNVA